MWEEMRVRSEDAAKRDKVRINQNDKRKRLRKGKGEIHTA